MSAEDSLGLEIRDLGVVNLYMIFKIMRLDEITKVVLDSGAEYPGQNPGPLLSWKEEEELATEAKK